MDPAPPIRASDAERDRTVTLLRQAAGEGRLTFEELADRVEAASTAPTRAQLERLTADLPVPTASVTGTDLALPARERRIFSDVRREGVWQVPAGSRWGSVFGNVVLDLRQARVTAPEVTIDVDAVFGDIELLVPEGIVVEIQVRTVFGRVKQRAGTATAPGAPRVILTGSAVFGNVKVRAKRLSERIAARLLGPE